MSSILTRTLRGGIGFTITNLIVKFSGLLFVLLAGRYLGVKNFGILAIAISIIEVCKSIGLFGLPITIQRFMSGVDDQYSKGLYAAIIFLAILISIILITTLLILAPWISKDIFKNKNIIEPLRLLSIGIILNIIYQIGRAILQAKELVKNIIIIDAVYGIGKIVFIIILFMWEKTIISAAYAIIISLILTDIIAIYFLREINFTINFSLIKDNLRTVLEYTTPLFIVGFGYLIAQQTDRLMLGGLTNATNVGLYTISSGIAMITSILHASFVSIFMPVASDSYKKGNMKGTMFSYYFISKWLGIINSIVLIFYAVFGIYILTLFGKEYTTSGNYTVLLLLSSLYFIGSWVGPTGALLQMTDGHKIELINTILFITINIVLNYLLIPLIGIIGAAVATLIAGSIRNLLQLIEIRKIHKLRIIKRSNIFILIVTVGGLLVISLFNLQIIAKIIAGLVVIFSLIYIGIHFSTDEEKSIFDVIKTKINNRLVRQ